jgi:hypothetical protein
MPLATFIPHAQSFKPTMDAEISRLKNVREIITPPRVVENLFGQRFIDFTMAGHRLGYAIF